MPEKITINLLIDAGLKSEEAKAVLPRINELLTMKPPKECWIELCTSVLTQNHPFEMHQKLHEAVFKDWDHSEGPPPAWFPTEAFIDQTNVGRMMKSMGFESYNQFHAWTAGNRSEFWKSMTSTLNIRFSDLPSRTMDLSQGIEHPEWFPGATLNIVDSCIDTDVNAPAILLSEESGSLKTISRHELLCQVNRVANSLCRVGLPPGTAIAIDMPMTAESCFIYLGIIKAGCTAVSIADSFAPEEIAKRIRISNARAVFTQDYLTRGDKVLPLYEKVTAADSPLTIVLTSSVSADDESRRITLRNGDLTWKDFLCNDTNFDSVKCTPDAIINILFSSGTTGDTKAIPWTQTTPVKCAADGHLHHDIRPGDVAAWPTNLGWMMGPWIIFATLINQGTIALYSEAPTDRQFGRFVQNAGVNILGLVPSMIRSWRSTDCMLGLDWSSVRVFSSTGECSNADDMFYLMTLAGYRPVIEYCGGTEIGGGYISGTVVRPSVPGIFSTPSLGMEFVILDEDGYEAESGEVFLIAPSIGLSINLINRNHHKIYYADTPAPPSRLAGILREDGQEYTVRLRRHGDQCEHLGGGYFRMHGRVDDTMNLGGIKVSSIEIERILNKMDEVQQTAAIAVSDSSGGPSRLVIYAVTDEPVTANALKKLMQKIIKEQLNPLFRIYDVVITAELPRTASNKIMRRVLRKNYDST